MSRSKIKPEDISVLINLMKIPGELIIYDPLGILLHSEHSKVESISRLLKIKNQYQVCLNLSDQPLEILAFDFILELETKNRKYTSYFSEAFLCFNNPDGTIRWIQPASCKKPCFLDLYNGSGIKAFVFKKISGLISKLGLLSFVFRHHIRLYTKQENYLSDKVGSKAFAIFTGTVGPNRKGVITAHQKNERGYFIKIPISKKSEQLIQTERRHLLYLNQLNLQKLIIPRARYHNLGLELTNIRLSSHAPNLHIVATHIEAITALYHRTFKNKVLKYLEVYTSTAERIHDLESIEAVNGLDERFRNLLQLVKAAFERIDANQIIPVAYAHGDFTPWNMFLEKDRIALYDWELAMPEQYLLYDFFHYIFQTGVLIKHQSAKQIKTGLLELEQSLRRYGLLKEYKIDFKAALHWYLVHNCAYYLKLYSDQQSLHQQAWWLIDCWTAVLSDASLFEAEKATKYKALAQK